MKIVLLHEWFVTRGGSEKVAGELQQLFKIKHVKTLFHKFSKEDYKDTFSEDVKVDSTFLQYVPFLSRIYRYLLPLFPMATASIDLKKYDVILSSSHCAIKNVKTTPGQIHICYCHTPMRYAWDLREEYFGKNDGKLKSKIIHSILDKLRQWDLNNSDSVTHFIANSSYIAERIYRNYGRSATVIYPPVDVESFAFSEIKGDYYIMANRLVEYKKSFLVASAFAMMPEKKLIIVGDGPEEEKIKGLEASNVSHIPYPGSNELSKLIQNAKAFIIASNEDFGISPVEAQATGTPTLAYKKGGALEYVIEGETGFFFAEQTKESIVDSVCEYDEAFKKLDYKKIRANAERFSYDVFRQTMKLFVEEVTKKGIA